MSYNPSPAEAFLTAFHDERPGVTSSAFGALSVMRAGQRLASSYALLADLVPTDAGRLTVLDLACGDGFLLELLAHRGQPGLSLAGVDFSGGELRAARARLGGGAMLFRARAQALPLADASVDCVLCHMALMLMDDAETVLAEVRRVLKPGGTLAAVVGAGPLPSLAFDTYVELFSRYPRSEAGSAVRLGDRRFGSPEGIAGLLAGLFTDLTVEELQIERRLAPQALWEWFAGMYDLYLLGEEDRRRIQQAYLVALAPTCEADGKVPCNQALRCIVARTSPLLTGVAETPVPGGSIDLVRQVTDTELAFARTMLDRDFTAFMSFVSAEAVFLNGGKPLRGKAAIAAHWQRFYTSDAVPFSWKPDLVVVLDSGTLAQSVGPVRGPDGETIARFHSTWRREDAGVWRIIFDEGYPVGPRA
jgi:SAM-dependent methyltransferase/ketosteroid isomerase-like protein